MSRNPRKGSGSTRINKLKRSQKNDRNTFASVTELLALVKTGPTEALAEATGSWRNRFIVALVLLFAAFGTVFSLEHRIEHENESANKSPDEGEFEGK